MKLFLFGILLACASIGGSVESKSNSPFSTHVQKRTSSRHRRQTDPITPLDRELCQPGSEIPSNRVNTTERVAALRDEMDLEGLSAYLISYEDEHISSPADHDHILKYISGFSGSNGYAWVLNITGSHQQALWTDGRYFLQADQQMDCDWILMKTGVDGYPEPADWLLDNLSNNSKVGIDPKLVSISYYQYYERKFTEGSKKLELVSVSTELVGKIWTTNRPPRPNEHVFIHHYNFTGETWQEKVQMVRDSLTLAGHSSLFISALDETAWVFNLRGRDRTTSAFFYSYGLIRMDTVTLYIVNVSKLLTMEIQEHLNTDASGNCANSDCVTVREYSEAFNDLAGLESDPTITSTWITPTSNYAVYNSAGEKRYVAESPIQLMKSIKTDVEKTRYRQCQIRDSAAVVEFVAELEKQIMDGVVVTELQASGLLQQVRSQDQYYVMNSFDTISAVGPNAAVIHYRPTPETDTIIDRNQVYLLDSGGQYFDGTTDVTRTFHFGTPNAIVIEAYSRVLIGVIELATTVWPQGWRGSDIDARTRTILWQNGWDYNHGTGHGIGYFLSVHEGPGRINLEYDPTHSPLYPGMFFSDEPGYYEDGYYGIRLETIVEVVVKDTPNNFNSKEYLGFNPVTLVPFEPKLINYSMLGQHHRDWLNEYNRRCVEETGDYLLQMGKIEAYDWLVARTFAIPDEPTWNNVFGGASNIPYVMILNAMCLVMFLLMC